MRRYFAISSLLNGVLLLVGGWGGPCAYAATASYPSMAPLSQYLSRDEASEIALARSAAPKSISANAEVRVLGEKGYHTAVEGTNGFVCIVERSWAAGFGWPEFWNPSMRGPTCYNAAAARSVLPRYIERTGWVLAGVSKDEMAARTRASITAKTFPLPETGAMSYMMSRQQHLNDAAGHWHPHVMFYIAAAAPATWGANMEGSPVYADDAPIFAEDNHPEPVTIFFVPVGKWSDGSDAMQAMHHAH